MSAGTVHGTAARSLSTGSFAKNRAVADVGARAELQTAEALVSVVNSGASVFHDLRMPADGIAANIDHIVVSGKRVLVLDSKWWAPGFYWTLGGVTRRGLSRFPHADKRTLPMAVDLLRRDFARLHIEARVLVPVMVVWNKPGSRLRLTFFRPQDATAVAGARLARRLRRRMPIQTADARIEARLVQLLIR